MSLACWDSSVEETRNMNPPPLHSHVHDGPPSLLPRHAGRINVVVIHAWSPFAVSGALYGLHGEEAEAPSTLCIIPCAGIEPSLQFSSKV
jgi:hypothetical protein